MMMDAVIFGQGRLYVAPRQSLIYAVRPHEVVEPGKK
jgi:hypothetical protein